MLFGQLVTATGQPMMLQLAGLAPQSTRQLEPVPQLR